METDGIIPSKQNFPGTEFNMGFPLVSKSYLEGAGRAGVECWVMLGKLYKSLIVHILAFSGHIVSL